MKLSAKSAGLFILLCVAGSLAGSLFWEVLERMLRLIPALASFTLTMTEPLRLFDLYVLSVSVRANPGTFLGLIAGIVLFLAI